MFSFTADLRLQNGRALLEPLSEKHYEALLPQAVCGFDLTRYSPFSIDTPEALHAWILASVEERERGIRYPLAIYDREKEAWAGSTSFASVSPKDGRLEIGWTWLGPAFQRTGLNRAVKALLLGYVFDTLGWERVEFRTDERNLQSRTAMEKLGATCEGILRSHTLMRDGFRRNTVYYSILKGEWKGRGAGSK